MPWDFKHPKNWKDIKKTLKAERGQRCSNPKCLNPTIGPFHDHHIIPTSKNGKNARFNIKLLCERCHNREHPHMFLRDGFSHGKSKRSKA